MIPKCVVDPKTAKLGIWGQIPYILNIFNFWISLYSACHCFNQSSTTIVASVMSRIWSNVHEKSPTVPRRSHTHHAVKLAPYGNKIASPSHMSTFTPPPPPPNPWIMRWYHVNWILLLILIWINPSFVTCPPPPPLIYIFSVSLLLWTQIALAKFVWLYLSQITRILKLRNLASSFCPVACWQGLLYSKPYTNPSRTIRPQATMIVDHNKTIQKIP